MKPRIHLSDLMNHMIRIWRISFYGKQCNWTILHQSKVFNINYTNDFYAALKCTVNTYFGSLDKMSDGTKPSPEPILTYQQRCFRGFHMRAISPEMFINLIRNLCLETTPLRLLRYLLEANVLNYDVNALVSWASYHVQHGDIAWQ